MTELADRRNHQSGVSSADPDWPLHRPATTVAGRGLVADPGHSANRFDATEFKSRNDGFVVTVSEAGVLQGFRADYPWQGTLAAQFRQVGDAMPPTLARVVIEALLKENP